MRHYFTVYQSFHSPAKLPSCPTNSKIEPSRLRTNPIARLSSEDTRWLQTATGSAHYQNLPSTEPVQPLRTSQSKELECRVSLKELRLGHCPRRRLEIEPSFVHVGILSPVDVFGEVSRKVRVGERVSCW